MRTEVHFRSAKFPAYEGEEAGINPGVWGKRLAEYLTERLRERGIAAGTPMTEDWGWYVPVVNEAFRLGLGCGHQNGEDDEFRCMIDPGKPHIRKWFKVIDTTGPVTQLADALDAILAADFEVRDVRWEPDDGAA